MYGQHVAGSEPEMESTKAPEIKMVSGRRICRGHRKLVLIKAFQDLQNRQHQGARIPEPGAKSQDSGLGTWVLGGRTKEHLLCPVALKRLSSFVYFLFISPAPSTFLDG